MRSYAAWAVLLVGGHAVKDTVLKIQGTTDSQRWQIAIGPVLIAVVVTVIGMGLNQSLKHSA